LIIAAVSAAIAPMSLAATDTWTGGSLTGSNWSDTANWGGAAVNAGDSLVFGGSTRLTPSDDLTALTLINGITFNAGSGAFVLGGNSITQGESIIDNATNAQSISLAQTLNATQNVTVGTGGTMSMSGVISGSGFGLNINGAGTLTMTGANTYSGGTIISNGIAQINTSAAAFGTGLVTVQSGGEANIGPSGALTVTNSFNIAGNGTTSQAGALVLRGTLNTGTITVNGSARIGDGGFGVSIADQITSSGAGNLEFFSSASGTSTYTISSASNNWAGSTTVTNASTGSTIATVLKMGASNVFPVTSPLTLNATSGGLAELDMAGRSITVAGLSSAGTAVQDQVINSSATASTLTINNANNATFGGAIVPTVGSISVTKTGTGRQTLSGTNTYTGATTVNLGTLSVTGSTLTTGAVSVNASTAAAAVTLAGTGSVGNVTLGANTAGGNIPAVNPGATGAGSVGKLTMSSLAVNGGSLQFDLVDPVNASANDSITVTGATTFSQAATIAPTAGEPAGTYTVLSSTGAITYTVTPTLQQPTVTGRPQSFSLNTNANNIQVVVTGGAANIVWAGGVGGFTGNGADGTTWDNLRGTGGGGSNDQNWNNSGTQDYFFDGDSVLFNDAGSPNTNVNLTTTVSPGAVMFNSAGNYSISGAGSIAGLASVTQSGTGSVTISTSNSYSDGTTINNGTLNANASSALGSGVVTLNAPGQLNINHAAFGSGALVINGGTIDNTSGAAITLTNNNPQTWAGNFTFTGSNNLNLGTGAVTLTTSPTITVTAGTLTVGGAIAGGGLGLTKSGSGTLVLSGGNTYTGATNINAGTVVATNSNSLGGLVGAAGVTINGGTLDVGGDTISNNVNFSGLPFTIAGTGVGGVGAVTNTGVPQFNTFRGNTVNLSADALISGNRIDIGRVSGNLNLNSHTLTLNMSGSQPMFGIENGALVGSGNIVVAAGTLDIEQGAIVQSDGVSTITYNTGTNAQFFQTAVGGTTRSLVFNGNNTIGSGSVTIGTVNSPMTLMGNVTFESITNGNPSATSNFPLILAGNISESGGSYSVTKAGVSTMTLSGINAWTGGTNIQNGTLQLASAGALPSGSVVTLGDGSGNSGVLDLGGNNATVGGLSVATGAGAANIVGSSGSTPVTLTFAGGTSAYSGMIQDTLGAGSGTVALTVSSGSLTLAGPNTYTGNTTVAGGVLTIDTTGSTAGANYSVAPTATLNVNGVIPTAASVNVSGTANFAGSASTAAGSRTIGALTVNSGATASITGSPSSFTPMTLSVTSPLSITGTGKIDVTNNILVAPGSSADAENLITTHAVVTTNTHGLALGYGVGPGSGNFEIRATLLGDSDLDGQVNVADLANLAGNFGVTTGMLWINGDFDYNHNVNVADLADLAGNFGAQLNTSGGAENGAMAAAIPAASGAAAVPEPASLGAIGLVIAASSRFGSRRRRRPCSTPAAIARLIL
jgi:autotransporter-associated beta strand protein